MKTKYKIDPSHIWDIRDDNLDATTKALLVRLAGLLHMKEIWVSNTTLAVDLGVSKRTIVEKMKRLAAAGYIAERCEVHEPTQTKVTEINEGLTIQKILGSVKGQRKAALIKHYGACRETDKKSLPPAPENKTSHFVTSGEDQLDELEMEILGH